MTPAHDVIVVGEGVYKLDVADLGISFFMDRLRRRDDDLLGELSVRCDLPGARRVGDDGTLSVANLNLSSVRERQARASLLAERAQTQGHVDWFGALEYFCQRIITAERTGQPAVLLSDLAPPTADDTMLIEGRPTLLKHPMMDFGDGGSLKSYLALWQAGLLAQRGVRVGYFDWEFDGAEHRARLGLLFGDAMPAIHYVRCEQAITHEADRLRRIVLARGLEYTIVDSVAVACGGRPEDAEVAGAFFRVLRQLRIGTLLIAHINRSETGDQRPFGSAFWSNYSRATWFIKRSEADGDSRLVTVAMINRKANTGPLRPALGFTVEFGEDQVTIQSTDLAQHEDFSSKLPLWQRMRAALEHGPLTLTALAKELDAKPDSLKKIVDRSLKRPDPMFIRVPGSDGIRISLVARKYA